MISVPLDEAYFEWLAVRVVNTRLRSASQTRWTVLRKLYTTEFIWRIHNDENRVEDGKELRRQFLEAHPISNPLPGWLDQGCSFLEMLVALSDRLTFQTEGWASADWFWHLLDNVGLNVSDVEFQRANMDIYTDSVLAQINDRTYDWNGRGGLFPLQRVSEVDHTQVELWYQMNYYLLERS